MSNLKIKLSLFRLKDNTILNYVGKRITIIRTYRKLKFVWFSLFSLPSNYIKCHAKRHFENGHRNSIYSFQNGNAFL